MSMKGVSSAGPDKIFKKSSHKRNDSGELDVFQAARYFSGYNEPPADDSYGSYTHKHNNYTRDENRRRWGRISLDLPIRSSEPVHHHPHQDHHVLEKHEVFTMKEKICNVKHKQPSSPGGKIASFLNSLFHQSGLKKNKLKSKSKPAAQARDEEESPGGWRRRRRSSISHFLMTSGRSSNTVSTTTNSSSKSLFSSSSSGFRTPPPCLNTPTKNYKEYINHVETDKKSSNDLTWLDEKLNLIETMSEGQRVWSENDRRKTNGQTVSIEDDGAESDSSSDLFELQNYDLSYGGLPVYETTNVDTIKKCAHVPTTRHV
ncbi:PREDICTED: protein BIG GRAIN 1-like E [Tarenaya hassleriana]|uniref:protein BIG GRAIN 1-like E n=1 Tax=Tarenaya hassleriana TaxID=28532 RepID=UPI00053C8661|nr:PREDICTED: protein BIG GRAIN 1-like E [Tarenaya hassleriana]XP_010525345.1 PREDICTED: protein BIG GRAIN 1-like E [Tarenaya hassleriana]XP_010552552.1 PREDICTED: protein BIG GRAIN 1-like E [Tarenaya hassleriana]